jgi:CRP-like cAMP-binding protein
VPPTDIIKGGTDLYTFNAWDQYWFCFYPSVFRLAGVEIMVSNNKGYAFAVAFYILGAIITAIIVGEMAVISTSLSRKATKFAEVVDNATTTMKNMKLPEDLQLRIYDYLMSTHKILEFKDELESFEQMIPPSVRLEVRANIYRGIVQGSSLLRDNAALAEVTTRLFQSVFYQPDESVVSMGEEATCMFFIASGKCQVEAPDQYKQPLLIRYLFDGDYFGELGLIYHARRSATVKTSVYSHLAQISKAKFFALLGQFPDLVSSFEAKVAQYKDPYRCFLKNCINNIAYLRGLPEPLLDVLLYSMEVKSYESNSIILDEGAQSCLMIVVEGSLSLSFKVKTSFPLLRLSNEEGDSSPVQHKRGWSLVSASGSNLHIRTESRILSLLPENKDIYIKVMNLGPGGVLGCRQVIVEATNVLRIRSTGLTTVMFLSYDKITSLARANPQLQSRIQHAKRSLLYFDRSCMEYLSKAPVLDCLLWFDEQLPSQVRRARLNFMKMQSVVLSVIKRNRELMVGGVFDISSFLKRLKAITFLEEKGMVTLAKCIARGELDPEVVATVDLLSAEEITKPILNKFAAAARKCEDAISRISLEFTRLESSLARHQDSFSAFEDEAHELQEIVSACELSVNM